MRPLYLAICLAATAWPVQAQGRVKGVLVDSLVTGKPLVGATVIVVGTTISRATDSRGRFLIDSVPVGKQLLTFFHSTLDSIGLGASMVEVDVADGAEADVALGTPSGSRTPRPDYSSGRSAMSTPTQDSPTPRCPQRGWN